MLFSQVHHFLGVPKLQVKQHILNETLLNNYKLQLYSKQEMTPQMLSTQKTVLAAVVSSRSQFIRYLIAECM